MKTSSLSLLAAAIVAAPSLSAQLSFGSTTFGTGAEPDGVALFDYDGDGDLDLAITVDAPDRVELYANTGGTFALATSVLTGANTSPHALVAADFDRDGDRDFAVSLKNVNQVRVYTNTAGTFASTSSFTTGLDPRELEAADLNGDGFVDLVTSNRDGNTLTVALSAGGAFAGTSSIATGAEPRELAIADFDGNGTNDVAVAAHDARLVQVFTAAGGALASLSTGAQLRPEGMAAADVNGDGSADLLSSTSGNGFNNLSVWLGTGAGTFGARADYPVGAIDPGSVVAADLDGDGDVDAATANQTSSSVSLMTNGGTGFFTLAGTVATGLSPTKLATADVNNDGGTDLVTANDDGNSATVMTNAVGQSLSVLVDPFVGSIGTVQLAIPAHAGEGYFCGFSLSTTGIALPGGSVLPLGFDDLLQDSLFSGGGAFRSTIGTLDGTGRAQVSLHVLPNAALAGRSFYAGAVVLGSSLPLAFGDTYGPVTLTVR